MTERRPPVHLAVLIGVSTAAYAVSLAGTAALQANTDQALILARTPAQEAAVRVGEAHDRLEAQVERSAKAYALSAATYDQLTVGLATLDTSLETYASRMKKVSGAARALPARASLPSVARSSGSSSSKPRAAATTAASGAP